MKAFVELGFLGGLLVAATLLLVWLEPSRDVVLADRRRDAATPVVEFMTVVGVPFRQRDGLVVLPADTESIEKLLVFAATAGDLLDRLEQRRGDDRSTAAGRFATAEPPPLVRCRFTPDGAAEIVEATAADGGATLDDWTRRLRIDHAAAVAAAGHYRTGIVGRPESDR
ncbi:MAG: hypothetical protein ACRC1K_02160 [Planctomycetia bacterium]